VLGHSTERRVEPAGDLARAELIGPHEPQDLPPRGLADDLEDVHGVILAMVETASLGRYCSSD
jgi:hypothetical protein